MTANPTDFPLPKYEDVGSSKSFLPDPNHLWMVFRRRIGWFFAAALIFVGLVAVYTLTRPTLYVATASVEIQPYEPGVSREVEPLTEEQVVDSNAIDTEAEILSSRRLAGRVATALDDRYPQFRAEGATLDDAPGTHPMAGALLSAVDVRRNGLTRLININAASPDPQLAADIANGFAREYLAQQAEAKSEAASEAGEFVRSRIDGLRAQAAAADRALQEYKIAHGLMSAEGATMAEQEVSVLNQQIAEARAFLAEKTGQLAAARAQLSGGGGGAALPATLVSSTVNQLRTREAELSGRLADVDARYGEQHPEVRRVRDELADTRMQLQRQIDRVVASLEAEAQAARSRLASLESSQALAGNALESNNSAQVGYLELERNAEAARSIYQAFLNRSREMISQEGLLRPNARIESLARVPSAPFSPNYTLAALLAAIGGVVAGLGAVGTAEYLDARIRTRKDVEDRLQVRYAGAIPDLTSMVRDAKGVKPGDYLVDHPHSAFAEAIRSLKTMVLLASKTPFSLAITSALPQEGKSSTSICLARALALSGIKTVLIDCDARRRSVSQELLSPGQPTLLEYLGGTISLDDALATDEQSDLRILGLTKEPPDGRDLFREGQLNQLLKDLHREFDAVILDTAPILGIAETRAVSVAADSTLLLCKWRHTSMKAADTAIGLLLEAGANVLGLALTLVDVRKFASTGENDVYHYYSRFEGYYTN